MAYRRFAQPNVYQDHPVQFNLLYRATEEAARRNQSDKLQKSKQQHELANQKYDPLEGLWEGTFLADLLWFSRTPHSWRGLGTLWVYEKGRHSRRGQAVVRWGQRGGPAGFAGATVFSFFTGVFQNV